MDTYYNYYPEEYIIENDMLIKGQTGIHMLTIDHLIEVFRQLVRTDGWLMFFNLYVTHPAIRNTRQYIVPDIAIVKIVLTEEEIWALKEWDSFILPPAVVVEVSSEITWENEINNRDFDKPAIYGRMGVTEYFVYDPDKPQVWAGSNGVRLRGWRFENRQPIEIEPDALGRLWSEELESYFVPVGTKIHLTDRDGNRRLTDTETAKLARQEAEQALEQSKQARQQAELALQQIRLARQEAEQALEQETLVRRQAELALQQIRLARQEAEVARQDAERRLAALLEQFEKNKE